VSTQRHAGVWDRTRERARVMGCVVSLAGLGAGLGSAEDGNLRTQFQAVRRELSGLELHEADRRAELSDRLFYIVQRWSVRGVRSHPSATAADLAAHIRRLDPNTKDDDAFDVSVVRLDGPQGTAWAIACAADWLGTFFVVAEEGVRAHVAWDVKAAARAPNETRDGILRWGNDVEPGVHDGPLIGRLAALPASAQGHARFYVDAVTQPWMGDDRPAQISIWEWTGSEARPLFMGLYDTCSLTHSVRHDGSRLQITTRENARTFFTCGSCDLTGEPGGIWTLLLTQQSVLDQGHRWALPRLKVLDDLIAGIRDGTDVSAVAADGVQRQIAGWLSGAGADDLAYPLGMIEQIDDRPYGDRATLHVVGGSVELTLTLVRRETNEWYATNFEWSAR
jgi:hypothetical protein